MDFKYVLPRKCSLRHTLNPSFQCEVERCLTVCIQGREWLHWLHYFYLRWVEYPSVEEEDRNGPPDQVGTATSTATEGQPSDPLVTHLQSDARPTDTAHSPTVRFAWLQSADSVWVSPLTSQFGKLSNNSAVCSVQSAVCFNYYISNTHILTLKRVYYIRMGKRLRNQ